MVGTSKVGHSGAPRALEGQALLGLIQALGDPKVAEARLKRLAEAEATAIAEREAADTVITQSKADKAEADKAIEQSEVKHREATDLGRSTAAEVAAARRKLAADQTAHDNGVKAFATLSKKSADDLVAGENSVEAREKALAVDKAALESRAQEVDAKDEDARKLQASCNAMLADIEAAKRRHIERSSV